MVFSSKQQFYRVTPATRRFELEVGPPLETHGGQRHRLYGEICGNPNGPVVMCLHGGPGAGSNPATRQFFDPDHYCIVQFDQRGAGRSRPLAAMEANTTPDLVQDIDTIADHLGVDRFILFGGSWGSTLALAYANHRPDRVMAMVLRGIFLGRQRDIDWFLNGLGAIQPEAHQAFLAPLTPDERQSTQHISDAYVRRLLSHDRSICMPAASAWAGYEDACATLADNRSRKGAMERFMAQRSQPQTMTKTTTATTATTASGDTNSARNMQSISDHVLAIARAEAYYINNGLFLGAQGLLDHPNVARWAHLPGTIVHGRYDMICQAQGAIALAQAWPAADLRMLDNAGHSTFEDGIAAALLRAMEALKSQRFDPA